MELSVDIDDCKGFVKLKPGYVIDSLGSGICVDRDYPYGRVARKLDIFPNNVIVAWYRLRASTQPMPLWSGAWDVIKSDDLDAATESEIAMLVLSGPTLMEQEGRSLDSL